MVHNMAPFIGACVQSLRWTDGIFIYDDHSTDGSVEVARSQSEIPIKVEYSKNKDVAFKRGELETRNYVIDRAFEDLGVDILVIADADELFSSSLRSKINDSFKNPNTDGIAFSIWHLYNEKQYIHFWETKINGVDMIDPHTRIIKRVDISSLFLRMAVTQFLSQQKTPCVSTALIIFILSITIKALSLITRFIFYPKD